MFFQLNFPIPRTISQPPLPVLFFSNVTPVGENMHITLTRIPVLFKSPAKDAKLQLKLLCTKRLKKVQQWGLTHNYAVSNLKSVLFRKASVPSKLGAFCSGAKDDEVGLLCY